MVAARYIAGLYVRSTEHLTSSSHGISRTTTVTATTERTIITLATATRSKGTTSLAHLGCHHLADYHCCYCYYYYYTSYDTNYDTNYDANYDTNY